MKTGFICASGFNLVATATRNKRRLIAVVLGSSSSSARTVKAAQMLERGFNGAGLAWLAPSLGTVETLPAIDAAPPDLRDTICGPHRKKPASENEEDDETTAKSDEPNPQQQFKLSNLGPPNSKPASLLGPKVEAAPIEVYLGPSRRPAESQFTAVRAKIKARKDKNDKSGSNATNQVAAAPASAGGNEASMPTTADAPTAPWLSFAPESKPSSVTDFASGQKPMPVPRPRPNQPAR